MQDYFAYQYLSTFYMYFFFPQAFSGVGYSEVSLHFRMLN